MKIFAKRKRKIPTAEEAAALAALSEADKAVLELLKKDPSTLNAKQRRMVKRYQDRKAADKSTSSEKTTVTASISEQNTDKSLEPITISSPLLEPAKPDDTGSVNADARSSDSDGSSDSDSDSSDDGNICETKQELGENTEKEEKRVVPPAQVEKEDANTDRGDTAARNMNTDEEEDDNDDDNTDTEMEKVKKMLTTLNSKQRRKLTRQLERDGKDALETVRQEAEQLLNDLTAKEEKKTKQKAEQAKKTNAEKKRKGADWSSLPPQERKRREEQRRKQQEAAERRALGETTAHSHPLNSERRRANRRKPKWQRSPSISGMGDIRDLKNEHHTSGFACRKRQRTF